MEEIATGFTSNQVLSFTFSKDIPFPEHLDQYTIPCDCISQIRVKGVLAKIHSKCHELFGLPKANSVSGYYPSSVFCKVLSFSNYLTSLLLKLLTFFRLSKVYYFQLL